MITNGLDPETDYTALFFEWAKAIICHPDYRHYLEVTHSGPMLTAAETVAAAAAEDPPRIIPLPSPTEADIITSLGGTAPNCHFTGPRAILRSPTIKSPILPRRIMQIATQATQRSESDEFEIYLKQVSIS